MNDDVFRRWARQGDGIGSTITLERVDPADVERTRPAPHVHPSALDWASRAKCRAPDAPDMTAPTPRGRTSDKRVAYCAGCPVRTECLALALALEGHGNAQGTGVFGGMTPAERARHVRARREVERDSRKDNNR